MKTGFQVINEAARLAIVQATLAALLPPRAYWSGKQRRALAVRSCDFHPTSAFATASALGAELDRPGNTAGTLGPSTDMFAAADGYVMVAAYFPDQWMKFLPPSKPLICSRILAISQTPTGS